MDSPLTLSSLRIRRKSRPTLESEEQKVVQPSTSERMDWIAEKRGETWWRSAGQPNQQRFGAMSWAVLCQLRSLFLTFELSISSVVCERSSLLYRLMTVV